MTDEAELARYKTEAERYRLMYDQSTDMLSRHSATQDWTFIDVTPACEKILGYSPHELIGTSGYERFHPEDADNLMRRSSTVIYRKGMYTNVHRYRHKHGYYVWLETTSRTIRDDNGDPLEIICVSRDVSERELAQQSTRRLARVVEASSDMILFCSHTEQQITYMNESCFNTLGIPKDHPATFYLNQLFTDALYNEVVKPALHKAADDGSWLGSIRMLLSSSSQNERIAEVREIIGHRNRNQTENPQVEYYTVIARDITAQTAAEKAAKQQQNEIAHMSRLLSVGEMATGLAHELNQPLGAIINYCKGTRRRLKDSSPSDNAFVNDAMEHIAKQAQRASDIIKRIRSYVRKTDHHHSEFSINKACEEVCEFLSQEARDQHISFEFLLDKDLPTIMADRVQIEQVLLNLIRNAIEAYQGTQKQLRPVAVSTYQEQNSLIIVITDTAKGIPDEQRNSLFEPFNTSKANGLGMGLPISQTIIENHGGQLWAESDGVSGTEFYIRLPLQE